MLRAIFLAVVLVGTAKAENALGEMIPGSKFKEPAEALLGGGTKDRDALKAFAQSDEAYCASRHFQEDVWGCNGYRFVRCCPAMNSMTPCGVRECRYGCFKGAGFRRPAGCLTAP